MSNFRISQVNFTYSRTGSTPSARTLSPYENGSASDSREPVSVGRDVIC